MQLSKLLWIPIAIGLVMAVYFSVYACINAYGWNYPERVINRTYLDWLKDLPAYKQHYIDDNAYRSDITSFEMPSDEWLENQRQLGWETALDNERIIREMATKDYITNTVITLILCIIFFTAIKLRKLKS